MARRATPGATICTRPGLRQWGTPVVTLSLLLGLASASAFTVLKRPLLPHAHASALMSTASHRATSLVRPLPSPEELRAAVAASACEGGISVVLFGSKQCAACRALLPRTRRLAAARRDVRFFSLESSKTTAEAFQFHEITAVPTFIVFDGAGAILEMRAGLALSDWPDFCSTVESLADSCSPWAA